MYKRNKFYGNIRDEIVDVMHYRYIQKYKWRYNRLSKKAQKMYQNLVFVDETYYDNYLRICNDVLKDTLNGHTTRVASAVVANKNNNRKCITLLTENAEYNAILILGFEDTSLVPTETKTVPLYAGMDPLS